MLAQSSAQGAFVSTPLPAGPRRDRRDWREIEAELLVGLRNHWYALLPTDEVPQDRPLGVRRLGEDLVVWRDQHGKIRVMADRCAHRGARLSFDGLHEGELVCRYHGWRYDSSGECTAIPSEGSACPFAKNMRIRAYPAEEHGGMLFAYFSSDGRAPHEPCPNPEELESVEWNGHIHRYHWRGANWFRAMENLVDPLHAPFLHAGTFTLKRTKSYQDTMTVEKKSEGIYLIGRKGQRLVNFDAVEYHFPSWFRLDIPFPWFTGPGGPLRVLVFVCPLDESSCQVYMVSQRRITGWKWWLWNTLHRLFLWRQVLKLIGQDEWMLASQRNLEALDSEHLVQGDLGIVTLRNLFREAIVREKAA